ncbi:MAG: ABC transporter ATPase [Flavobacteriales bacterium]
MCKLEDLSPQAKVWIYQSDRPFTTDEKKRISEMGDQFVADWSAHGTSLKACFRILYDRFLAFFVDEGQQEATGCSIDRSVHFIKGLESNFDLNLLDRKLVAFRSEQGIETLPFDRIDRAIEEGRLKRDSIVFNNLVRTKKEFEEEWEVPLHQSWYSRLIKEENLTARAERE